MLWDLDRSNHQRNYFPNCSYSTCNFERCRCLSRHFTWFGVMRIPSVVAAWIRHVRACAPAGHLTVDIGLLKNAKFQGGFKKWIPFSHLSQILYELEKKSSSVTRALSAKSCTRDTDSLHSCTRLRLVQEIACLYHSCKILPRKHSYPNLIPIVTNERAFLTVGILECLKIAFVYFPAQYEAVMHFWTRHLPVCQCQ